jgi:hypothetical protein
MSNQTQTDNTANNKKEPLPMKTTFYIPGKGLLNRDPYETNYYFCLIGFQYAPLNLELDFRNA